LARVAGSLRRVIDRMVGTSAPPEVFDNVADRLDELANRLEAYDQRSLFQLIGPSPPEGAVTEFSPVTGRCGSFDAVGVMSVVLLVFTLMLADFFDTMGSVVGIGAEANLLDGRSRLPNADR